ncbi:hypothetical protein DFH07DRAFT_882804 [Mycena maculata]|uniref:Uncharacterized protein n=1 Tax=Mycena maculata TaxID=230809 RepID=A0AAD7NHT3_9AGAR|nr:hypothetical protein DFH07DRAFT_882804 [Mycena maculata]
MGPRSLYTKILAIGGGLTLFTLSVHSFYPTASLTQFSFLTARRGTCSPKSYADGEWIHRPRTSDTLMVNREDALRYAGFEGCASSREYYWHLAADNEEHWNRFPDVNSWQWQPKQPECHIQDMQPLDLLRELVEEGGWLLIGDSITEGHFFSLSCMLHPHVRATPDYRENEYWDRAWPQNLYFDPGSPLISRLNLPVGFSFANTPLVTFRRVDLLLEKHQLIDLHHRLYVEPANFSLFSDEAVWSLDPAEYTSIFTSPEANYKTMVVSTAGHWTTTLFDGYRDEAKTETGFGIEGVIQFFSQAAKKWANDVQRRLTDEKRRNPGKPERQVVVRAYLPGHEDCHDEFKPWDEIKPFVWNWWNWGSIWEFNEVFEELLSLSKYPNIHYLAIDRPARLRPDAHVPSDCLHIMAGAGVLEGWSHYIWHFVTREIGARRIR